MKYAALCKAGLESLLKKEIENLGGSAKVESFYVAFDIKDINKLLYSIRLASSVLQLHSFGQFNSFDELVQRADINIPDKKKARINATRTGEHSFTSVDVERALASKIDLVDLSEPDVIGRVFIVDNEFITGLDLAGFDMAKRQYKVFNHPATLSGPLAMAASLFADFSADDTFLDPLVFDGSIVIEAALYISNTSVYYFDKKFDCESWLGSYDYDSLDKSILSSSDVKKLHALDPQFKNLSAMKKNAKIAGVTDYLKFSKCDIDDLDLKFYEGAIDLIVTKPLEPSKKVSEEFASKITGSIFKRGADFLSAKGRIVFVSKKIDFCVDLAESFGYELVDSLKVSQGKSMYYLLKFVKEV